MHHALHSRMCTLESYDAVHQSQMQRVKINNNERVLANKVEQEKNIMKAIVHMHDEPTDDAEQVGKFADPGLRPSCVCAARCA